MPSCYTLACFTKPFKSLPSTSTTRIRDPSPSGILPITKRQKRRCKMPNFLQYLFSKREKKTTPSKNVVFYSEPSRWTCDTRSDIRPTQRFDVSPGTSLVEEDVHVSDNGRSGAIALAIYTMDPCAEFRRSMQEMMDAHHVDSFQPLDWNFMQELLLHYLKLNEKKLHKYIIDAFLDLMEQIPSRVESGSQRNEERLIVETWVT